MKIFLSSSRDNRAVAARVMDDLEAMGHEITLRWDKATAPAEYTDTQMKELQAGLYEGILNCDVYILLLPGGINSHVELGVAITSGRRCFVLSEFAASRKEIDPKACAFYFAPNVERVYFPDPGASVNGYMIDWLIANPQQGPRCEGCE